MLAALVNLRKSKNNEVGAEVVFSRVILKGSTLHVNLPLYNFTLRIQVKDRF